jgi:hydroxymethylglutaryl-CoA synthase
MNIGNTYTAAAFANLLCLVSTEAEALAGKRVGVFSYGSGAIATLYALEVTRARGVHLFVPSPAPLIAKRRMQ